MTLSLGNRDAGEWFEVAKHASLPGNFFARLMDGKSRLELRGFGITTAEIAANQTLLTLGANSPELLLAQNRVIHIVSSSAMRIGEVINEAGTVKLKLLGSIAVGATISFDETVILLKQ